MNTRFRHNPFSSILKEELEKTLVPRFNVDELVQKIENSDSLAVEFLGKQGRGKTTHLLYMHNQMNHFPLYMLNAKSNITNLMHEESKVIFIDSIHHLGALNRIRLFKVKKTLVFTTHWTRKLECMVLKKKLHTIKFKGINLKLLKEIIDRRVTLASKNGSPDKSGFVSDSELEILIKEFGDDYRGILNHLYERYQ